MASLWLSRKRQRLRLSVGAACSGHSSTATKKLPSSPYFPQLWKRTFAVDHHVNFAEEMTSTVFPARSGIQGTKLLQA